ncbi:hypothetical protein N7G274_004535 [Stereocaulon virgatum]|uniref:Uncharacterized protein n=1 Tax=Stereocaulon virgatum TaxID=373712 RepID=A0ABR4ABE6_9LECA
MTMYTMNMFAALLLPAALITAGALAAASNPPAPRNAPSAANIRRQQSPSATSYGPSYNTAPHYSFDELFQLQKEFLDNFIYPANQVQAKSVNSSLLAPDVQGRVDITRTFTGQELNTEYLFGLFANIAASPDEFTLLGVPLAYEITHFAASQNIASASTRFNFSFPLLGNLIVPVEIETWNVFDKNGKISQYDATFKWWQWTFDYLIQTAAAANKMNLTQIEAYATDKLATSICSTAQTHCNGTNTQYNSTSSCHNYLTTQIRFGEAYELGRNTLLCRMVHQNMVPIRPDVHCPHIGPSGGGYCDDDTTYVGTVTQNYFTNFPFVYGGNATG